MKKLFLIALLSISGLTLCAQVKSDTEMGTYNNTYIRPGIENGVRAANHNMFNRYIIASKIHKDSLDNVYSLGDTALVIIYKGVADTVLLTVVEELNDLSDVNLNTPDASDILMLDDETMKWVNYPLSYLAGLLVDSADMDTSKWTRSGNHLYPKVIGDSVGIGTATPVERLDVQNGNINLDTSSATSGQITQNGIVLMHTYSDNVSEPNLFIGGGGNFTMNGNNNIGIGSYSLMGNTSGYNNNAIGYYSMSANATGIMNVAIGDYTLNNSSNGFYNVAVGYGSLNGNTSGTDNTAAGCGSMTQNTTGNANVSIGSASLGSNTTGNDNTAVGNYALSTNVGNTGSVAIGKNSMLYADDRVSGRTTYNTAVGYEAMRGSTTAANNTGQYNTAAGYQALMDIISGDLNTGIGYTALSDNTTGYANTGVGSQALGSNTEGYNNTAFGTNALGSNIIGNCNTSVGVNSLYQSTGSENIGIGYGSGPYNLGNKNILIGVFAGQYDTLGYENIKIGYRSGYSGDGNKNIFIGNESGYNETGSNKLYIENSNADSAGALIFGNFATDKLRINGTLEVENLPLESATSLVGYNSTTKQLVSADTALVTELDGLSDVVLTTPDASDMLILDDETMKWVNRPLIQVYRDMLDTAAKSPTKYDTWVRDTTKGSTYPALLDDNIGVGKLPYSKLDISGTAKSNDFITQSRFYKSIVTFSFDDGHSTNYETMYPLFQAKGIGATENVVINWVGDADRMTWGQLQDLVDAGWEIAGHSLDHNHLPPLTPDSVDYILKTTKDSILSHGIKVNTFAYPYSDYVDSTQNIARKYYRAARSSLHSRDSIMSGVFETYALVGVPGDTDADSAKYRALIDRLNLDGGWVIFYIHETDAGDSARIANLIDYIQARDIPILTTDSALNLIGNQVDVSNGLAFRNTDMRLDGTIYRGINTYLHTYEDPTAIGINQFWGVNAGNMTMSPAGGSITLSSYNLGIGYESLNDLTTGYQNTTNGYKTLSAATTGYNNTANGFQSSLSLVDGNNNTTIGSTSGLSNVTGDDNTYIGFGAGYWQVGNDNTYVGYRSGLGSDGNSTANNNTGIGTESMLVNRDGNTNTAVGYRTLYSNLTGDGNAAFGNYSMRNNTGNLSSAFGDRSMYFGTGAANTFIGNVSGYGATGASTGTYNAALGIESLYSYTTADQSVAVGGASLRSTTTGDYNTAIGYTAGYSNATGSYNIMLGYRAGYKETGSYKYYVAMDSTSWAVGMASGSKLLLYADQSNAAKSNHFLNIFAKVSIGAAKNPNEMLSVTGNASITGYLKSGTGSIADNDSTPSVASYNTFIYAGSANPVSIDALDDHVVGCYYTLIGNSNTYTITVIDGTPAGGDSFNLAGGNWVGGSQDVLLLYCIAADAFIEVSRSDN